MPSLIIPTNNRALKAERFILSLNPVFWTSLPKHDGNQFVSDDASGKPLSSVSSVWTNQGRYFNGTSAYLTNPTRIDSSTQGTLAVWFKIDTQAAVEDLFGFGGAAAVNSGFFAFRYRQNASVYNLAIIQRSDGEAIANIVIGDSNIPAGSWQFGALTSNGSSWNIYSGMRQETLTTVTGANNGNWLGATTVTSPVQTTIGALWANGGATNFTTGTIGMVALFPRVMTYQSIVDLYQITKWRFV